MAQTNDYNFDWTDKVFVADFKEDLEKMARDIQKGVEVIQDILHPEDESYIDTMNVKTGEALRKSIKALEEELSGAPLEEGMDVVGQSDEVYSKADHDPVNRPSHYTAYDGLQIIDLTEQMNFNRGNAVKYVARAGLKNKDTEIEDLEKAGWYIQREIERLQKRKDEELEKSNDHYMKNLHEAFKFSNDKREASENFKGRH